MATNRTGADSTNSTLTHRPITATKNQADLDGHPSKSQFDLWGFIREDSDLPTPLQQELIGFASGLGIIAVVYFLLLFYLG